MRFLEDVKDLLLVVLGSLVDGLDQLFLALNIIRRPGFFSFKVSTIFIIHRCNTALDEAEGYPCETHEQRVILTSDARS